MGMEMVRRMDYGHGADVDGNGDGDEWPSDEY